MLLMPLVDRFNAVSCLSSVKRGGRERKREKLNTRHLEKEHKKQEGSSAQSIGDNSKNDRIRSSLLKSSGGRKNCQKDVTAICTRPLSLAVSCHAGPSPYRAAQSSVSGGTFDGSLSKNPIGIGL